MNAGGGVMAGAITKVEIQYQLNKYINENFPLKTKSSHKEVVEQECSLYEER